MTKHSEFSIKRVFVKVDARFGKEWTIPYKEVRAAWKKYDDYFVEHPDFDFRYCGLLALVAPASVDYLNVLHDIAKRHKEFRV